ncbi:hypothetical protein SKTS_12340 [Sulfurimicrobium lacus]|uniref:Uncharacterized protein n=1 Tax=Sulfurimicrobium lacus TaxID=2715678 RepID=A0A6F8V9G8_9PROT|nr:hypothetical protein [Sulfurimicrobium lacus]BCB26348.1 hypothetical protein SKTS_12340 [Sulfurimicrobium lacus]
MFDLLALFRTKPSGFLTSAKTADAWLQDLRGHDEYEAQKQVIDALSGFLKSQEPLTRERLKVLRHVDETSQAFQKKLGETYFQHQNELKRGEDVLWKSMTTLFSRLAHSYQLFIHEIVAQRGKSEFTRYLPTIAARTLHYYAQGIKWGYFHQEPVQPVMWKRLHKYYLMCENARLATTEVELNSKRLTTCCNEYMQILLLDMIKPMTLPPDQIEMVDHWLDHWSHLVPLEQDCDPETHMHCVDLSTGVGARKLLEEMHGPDLRCWSMVDLYLQIRKSRTGLTDGNWSEHVELGDECVLPDCIDLLDYVARYWIRPEAARRQCRAPVEDRMVEMACGVGAIYSCLQPEEARPGHKIPFEHWSVQDESEGGYGLVEARPTERAQEGKLVLVKPSGHDGAWEIGVVRWKRDSESGMPALGVERLSDAPKQVELTEADGGEGVIKALFLPKLYQRDINSSLILQSADFREGRLLDMHYRNNVFHVRLAEVVDSSEEWVRVHFTVLGNRTPGAKAA